MTSPDKKEEKSSGPYQGKYCYLPKYIRISNINQPVPFKRHFLIAEESHSCWQLIYECRNVVSWTIASLELRKRRNKWCSFVRFFSSLVCNFFLSTFRKLVSSTYMKLARAYGRTANHCIVALSESYFNKRTRYICIFFFEDHCCIWSKD